MNLITNPSLLKLEVLYQFYSAIIRSYCPFCRYKVSHKTKTYHSLKSLGHHIALEHKDSGAYPFSTNLVNEILKVLAFAMQIGMLPCERASFFPRVKRALDE